VVCWRGPVLDGAAPEFSKTLCNAAQGTAARPSRPARTRLRCQAGLRDPRARKRRQGPDRVRKSVETAQSAQAPAVSAQVLLLLSEDGDEECRCAEQTASEGGGAAGAATTDEM